MSNSTRSRFVGKRTVRPLRLRCFEARHVSEGFRSPRRSRFPENSDRSPRSRVLKLRDSRRSRREQQDFKGLFPHAEAQRRRVRQILCVAAPLRETTKTGVLRSPRSFPRQIAQRQNSRVGYRRECNRDSKNAQRARRVSEKARCQNGSCHPTSGGGGCSPAPTGTCLAVKRPSRSGCPSPFPGAGCDGPGNGGPHVPACFGPRRRVRRPCPRGSRSSPPSDRSAAREPAPSL